MPCCAIEDQEDKERTPDLDRQGSEKDEVGEANLERRGGGVRAVALFLDVDHLVHVLTSSSHCCSPPLPPLSSQLTSLLLISTALERCAASTRILC
jgi:hypothetical protein